jgi:hypothetical protein
LRECREYHRGHGEAFRFTLVRELLHIDAYNFADRRYADLAHRLAQKLRDPIYRATYARY